MVVTVLRVVWTTGTRVDAGQLVRLWQQYRWENGLDQGDGSEKWSDSGYTLKQVLTRFIDGLNVILESKTERQQENPKNFGFGN